MSTDKLHLYFVPGLAADPSIFDYLNLPEDRFELHYLPWLLPVSEYESIEDYAQRMAQLVVHKNPVLVGVSFGGIMVQEMSKHLHPKKIILISSVKCREELPKRLKVIQKSRVFKLFPTKVLANFEDFSSYAFGEFAKKRVELYRKFLSMRDNVYLNWAIYHVLHWQQKKPMDNIIHIHGNDDHVFPIKHISNCIPVEKGTHVMILNKAKSIGNIMVSELDAILKNV